MPNRGGECPGISAFGLLYQNGLHPEKMMMNHSNLVWSHPAYTVLQFGLRVAKDGVRVPIVG